MTVALPRAFAPAAGARPCLTYDFSGKRHAASLFEQRTDSKVSLDIFAKYAKLHDMTEIRILKVPEDLKRALKVRAATEDKGLNDLILEILIASVEKANSKGAR